LPGENSPIHWGSYIFLSGATDKARAVDCFDAETGKQLWQRAISLPDSAKAEPPKVMDDTGYAAPTMACDGTRVFAIFANGDLACFDFAGKQLWARNLGRPDSTYGYAASLMLFSGHLIVQYDQGSDPDAGKSFLLALNTATGSTIWKTKRPVPASWSTPILIQTGAQAQIITCANPWVISYDPLNGQEIWRAQCLNGDVAPSPIYAGGLVFAAVTEAKLVAIRPDGHGDVTKTHIAWSADDGLPDIVSPISNGQVVLLVDSNGALTCYDAANGKKLWDHAYDNAFRASPLLVNNHFMLLDVTGVMHTLDAGRAFKEIGTSALGEATDCTPAVGDGRLYIRGKTHLFCIGAG
jgi:outer membrane protein assembly factor BamB